MKPPSIATGGDICIFRQPMLVTCQQMHDIEAAAFARGAKAAALMEEAGCGIAAVVRQFFPEPGVLALYLGKGNNAGDALVAARELKKADWRLLARLAFPKEEFKELPLKHWRTLQNCLEDGSLPNSIPGRIVLLDGLLGIGASGALAGQMRALAAEMNQLRRERHAVTIAMDIPSGLNGDTGSACPDAVEADVTATIGFPKLGLVADAATRHVGRLALVPLPELTAGTGASEAEILRSTALRAHLPRRSFDFHKGMAGRVGVLAGSDGFIGAGALAAMGALRGGAGLVTWLVRMEDYALAAAKAPPEVMVRGVTDYREALTLAFDALVIGPGIGFAFQDEVLEVIRSAEAPVIVDADALTMIGRSSDNLLLETTKPRLLTPHPGEMARLISRFPQWQGLGRRELAEAFVAAHPHITLLLKGARTVITQSGRPTCFNTTGNPGMATGGMGDLLSGLCAALIAQGASLHSAACLGAWLSGRAAEIAITSGGCSIESLAAGDVAASLGAAFEDLCIGAY